MVLKPKLQFAFILLFSAAIIFCPIIACAQTPIDCGVTTAGSISVAGEQDSFTFTGAVNDVVTIRVRKTSGTLVPYLELYNPSETKIAGPSTQIDTALTVAGTYRILVKVQNNTKTGDYVVYWQRKNNPCNVTADLACDQVVSGSIGTAVDPPPWRIYTFTAAANDVVTIRARKVSGASFYTYMELYSPTGATLQLASTLIDRTLTASGTYTILMRDSGNTYAGNFTLSWRKVSTPCSSTPINCGQILSGSISSADQINFYTFTAAANDVVTVRVRKISGTFTPCFEIYNPAGSPLLYGPWTEKTQTLTTAGTYKILVRDQYNVNSGEYILYMERMNGPCNVTADLACEQVVSGSIGTAQDPPPWRIYTFTAAANDAVTIRARKVSGTSFNPAAELYSPSGTLLVNQSSSIDRTLTEAGTYTILMRDSGNTYAGTFTLSWRKVNTPCSETPINCGQILSGSISAADQINFYTFTAAANDVVTIRVRKTSGTFNPYFELYGPTGSLVWGPGPEVTQTLTTAGIYKILVRDQYNVNSGDYILYMEKVKGPCNVTADLACEQVVSGSIGTAVDPPAFRIYTFTAAANDAVTIRPRKISGPSFSPVAELYSPSGTLLYTGSTIDRTLTAAGSYTILMRDSGKTYAGNFTLSWRKVSTPCSATPINCGQILSGSISASDQINFYTFTAAANDVVTMRVWKISGTFNPYFELYGPSGSWVWGPGPAVTQTLTTAGTYKILVRDQTNVNTGNYVLMYQKVKNPCSAAGVGCGQTVAGRIGKAMDPPPWRFYTFMGSVNDAVSIRVTTISGLYFNAVVDLYSPSGTLLVTQSSSIDRTLTEAGVYTMLARDANNQYEGNYTLKIQKNNNSCSEVVVTAPNGWELAIQGSIFPITWTCSGPQTISSQEIRLSTDGGITFPNIVASGLQGDIRTFDWNVPTDVTTTQGRIRVSVTDTSGVNGYDDSDADFTISQGVQRTYVYDELGRLIQVIYEDGKKINYTYDAAGNRITVTNE